jgi:alpha-L-fucosidase
VIDLLVDIVSKNGNLLLNFPLPNSGELDYEEMAVLDGITTVDGGQQRRAFTVRARGRFTAKAHPRKVKIETGNFNEDKQKDLGAEDVRFTAKGQHWSMHFVMGWPEKSCGGEDALGLASPQNSRKNPERGVARLRWEPQLEARRGCIEG